MSIWQSLVLGLVQGLTEFLPVSSSAHLVLVPELLRVPSPPLAFDVVLHLATLLAVVGYFWRDLRDLAVDGWRGRGEARHVILLLLIGTVPAAILGLLGRGLFERLFASPVATAWQLALTGVLLFAADRWHAGERRTGSLTVGEAVFVGFGQAVAIIPGISRSGATIAFGLWRGLARAEAARFSFLLSIPAILGAGLVEARPILSRAAAGGFGPAYAVGFLAALISGAVSIAFFLRYLRRGRLLPFAIYCWVAAGIFLGVLAMR